MLIKALGADWMSTYKGVRVGLGQVLKTGQAGEGWLDRLEAYFHLFVNGLQPPYDLGQLVILGLLDPQLSLSFHELLSQDLFWLFDLFDLLGHPLQLLGGEFSFFLDFKNFLYLV